MARQLSIQSVVTRNVNLVTTNIDGEIVMMSIDNGEYYGLDETGTRIWELLETPQPIHQLIQQLLEEFDVAPDECQADTLDFLDELLQKELISIVK